MLPAAVAFSVACVCGASLLALRWVLAFKATKLTHAPLAEMQARIDGLENKLLGNAMRPNQR